MYKVIEITWEEYRALNSVGVWTYWSENDYCDPTSRSPSDLPGWVNEWSEEDHAEWLAEKERKFFTRVECDE